MIALIHSYLYITKISLFGSVFEINGLSVQPARVLIWSTDYRPKSTTASVVVEYEILWKFQYYIQEK